MIPLSKIGIGKEEREMLSKRLFPQVNEIFLANLAKQNGINPKLLEELDYSNHPQYIMEKMMKSREQKALMVKNFNTSKHDYKYKTIEEAQEKDKTSTHVLIEQAGKPIDELNDEILELQRDFQQNKIKGITLDELSSDDEKMDVDDEKIWDPEEVKEATKNSC